MDKNVRNDYRKQLGVALFDYKKIKHRSCHDIIYTNKEFVEICLRQQERISLLESIIQS